jgi:hypothetical protein
MQKGILIEDSLVEMINGKRLKEMEPYPKEIVQTLFPESKKRGLFHGQYLQPILQTDFQVWKGTRAKNVSVKSGKSDSMGFENIKSFILYLRIKGISEETQKTILYYHYGDGTMTGSGKRRWTYEQVSSLLLPRIQKANVELNTKEMINCALDRFVFKGSSGRVISADFVLFGGSKFGSLYSQEEIRLAATHKHYSYSRALHFGPLLIQPYLRDVRGKSGNQSKRETLQAKWHYMQSDLEQSIEKSNRDAPVQ